MWVTICGRVKWNDLSCRVTVRLHKHAQDWRQHLACPQRGGTDFPVCGYHLIARVWSGRHFHVAQTGQHSDLKTNFTQHKTTTLWMIIHTIHTLWTKKHTKMLLSYLPQNPANSDKICHTLSWINLRYSSVNFFQLIWIMSLHYLVKLSLCVL